ncbi:shugoshin 2-like isoform X1 [Acipenser ruthenus]|uniref:shugoshin 2-like isoform X1 n=1 Tax=Acipenser ruthenus TaxID=7906 RepID=UPI0015603011|nr:shugoshin 2-like isoform X1 [Acipenser ruthenus]
MFAPATAGGPSTMDVLRERMLEKKQGSLKAAKLNTSLALKIKTKILNNSSIVHTSMKINNKALALALSAQKEKCKLLEQEMIKLQKEAVMLYVQNASYSHRQNHLLSLLKELQQSTHERLDAAVQMCSVEDCPSPTGSKRSSKPPLPNNAGTSFQNVGNKATCAAQKSPVVSLEKPVLQPQPGRPVQEKCFLQSPLEENAVNRQPEPGHFLEDMHHIDQEDAGIFASPSPVVKEPSNPTASPDRVIKKGRRSCLVTAELFEIYSEGCPETDDSTVVKTRKNLSGVGSPGVSLAESNGSKESLELQVPKQETTVFDPEMELTVNEETEIVTVESNSCRKNVEENRAAKPRSKKGDPEALRNIKKRDPSEAIPLVNSTRPVSKKQRRIKPLDTDKAISDAVGSDLQTASSASASEVSVAANKQLHQGEERCRITDASLNTECKDRRNAYKVSVFQNAEYKDCRKAGIISSEALKYTNQCEQSRAQLGQVEEPLDQPKDLLKENTLADFQTVETKPQDFLNVETKESRRTYLVSGPPSGTDWNTAGKDNRRTFVISDFQKAKPTASGLSHVEPGQEENLQNLALKDKPVENAHSSNLKLCDGAFVMSDRYVTKRTKRENSIITPPLHKADGDSAVEVCETEVCESNSTAKVSKHKDNSSRKRRNVVDEICAEIGKNSNNTVTHIQPESGLNEPVVQCSAKRSRIPQKSCSNATQVELNANPNRKTYVVHPANKLKSSKSSPENQTKKVKSKSRCAKIAFKEAVVPNPCFVFTHNESECVKDSKTTQENHLEDSGTPLKRESSSLETTNSDRAGGVILKPPCVQKASAGGRGGVRVCSVQDTCASEQTPMTVASPGAAAQRAEERSAVLESLQKLVQEDSSLGGFQCHGPETQECGLFQNLHSLVNTVKESEKIAHTVKRSRDKTPDGRILQTITNTSSSTCEEAGIAKKRRRAAAVANYKEPRLNSKLRREDQEKLQPSVYKVYK